MGLLELLIQEGRDDALRPWWRRSTGGILVGIVLLVLAAQLLIATLP